MNKMSRKKIKHHHAPGEHIWEPMQEYVMTPKEEEYTIEESDPEGKLEIELNILKKLKPNQYFIPIDLPATQRDISRFENYINGLNKMGLDVGRGEAEYGFKMPFADKGEIKRKLIIFRRYE